MAYQKSKFGTKAREFERTAEMLPGIAREQGVYFVVALLMDSGYERSDIEQILPILEKTPGACAPATSALTALKDLLQEVDDMASRVGWAGTGARERARDFIDEAEGR